MNNNYELAFRKHAYMIYDIMIDYHYKHGWLKIIDYQLRTFVNVTL